MSASVEPPAQVASAFAAKWGLSVPVDTRLLLEALAAEGLDVRIDNSMLEAGMYIPTGPSHGEVSIRGDDPLVRQRFTLAHETGHHLGRFMEFDSRQDEERWCDEFAATLLVPSAWIAQRVKDRRPNLDLLVGIADAAEVSRLAALTQLNSGHGWNSVLLVYRFGRNAWRLWNVSGAKGEFAAALASDPAADDVLAPATDFARVAQLPILVSGKLRLVPAEITGDRAYRWAMIERSALS